MSQRADPGQTSGLDERQVAAYLIAHPDFLLRHPEVLAIIDVPHRIPGAVSLIEYQVRRLRQQLAAERRRLAHLIARAREYESLTSLLHTLTLKLMAIEQPAQFCHLLRETLLREFQADALALKLFARQTLASAIPDPLAASFMDFIDRRHALCGPLSTKQARALFGESGACIQSAAIIPLQSEEYWGVIIIGSNDPVRFVPDSYTPFLNRLGELIGQKLRTVCPDHCH